MRSIFILFWQLHLYQRWIYVCSCFLFTLLHISHSNFTNFTLQSFLRIIILCCVVMILLSFIQTHQCPLEKWVLLLDFSFQHTLCCCIYTHCYFLNCDSLYISKLMQWQNCIDFTNLQTNRIHIFTVETTVDFFFIYICVSSFAFSLFRERDA